jgi:hypothetical protein
VHEKIEFEDEDEDEFDKEREPKSSQGGQSGNQVSADSGEETESGIEFRKNAKRKC